MAIKARLAKLQSLAEETFLLWDQVRIGWSWRHYYLNHTLRVRALALELGKREGADPDVVAFAATLHDITKRYDGNVLMGPDGKRQVDKDGYWMTETLQPARENRVTRLYDALGLAGQPHHYSGAVLAEHLLAEEGFPPGFAAAVAAVIRAHVAPQSASSEERQALYRAPEARVLSDADLIDANLGLVAFYRNIQIHAGRMLQQTGSVDAVAYLDLAERWISSKNSFPESLLTPSGREVAEQRQARNRQVMEWITEESALGQVAWEYGLLGVIAFLLADCEDPSLARALRLLEEQWLPNRQARLSNDGASPHASVLLARSYQFRNLLHEEIAGRL
ncbi:MAG TPA: HD domain-containing protein [Armatimonadetes bacterium]|nr:HD domain-containing protein [Armatimonadota bacterium]